MIRRSDLVSRLGLWVLLLVVHGAAFVLWPMLPPRLTGPGPPPMAWVRVVAAPHPPVPPRASPAPSPMAAVRGQQPAIPVTAFPSPTQVDPLPVPAQVTSPPPVEALPDAAPPPALHLDLPRALNHGNAIRDLVRGDPRANSSPRRPIDALTRLSGERTRLAEIPLAGEGRRLVILQGRCAEVHDARIAQIDPFNQSVAPTPKQVRPCD